MGDKRGVERERERERERQGGGGYLANQIIFTIDKMWMTPRKGTISTSKSGGHPTIIRTLTVCPLFLLLLLLLLLLILIFKLI